MAGKTKPELPTDRAVSEGELFVLIVDVLYRRDSPNPEGGQHGLLASANDLGPAHGLQGSDLSSLFKQNGGEDQLSLRIAETLNELLISGLVMLSPLRSGAICYALTSRGRDALRSGSAVTYVPTSYLSQLEKAVPNLDPLVVEYVDEGIRALNSRLTRAAAVMIGVAAEKVMRDLGVTLHTALRELGLPHPKGLIGHQISEVRRTIKSSYDSNRSQIKAISERLGTKDEEETIYRRLDERVQWLFTVYKFTRDEQGHASGQSVGEERLRLSYENLLDFVQSVDRIQQFLTQLYARAEAEIASETGGR